MFQLLLFLQFITEKILLIGFLQLQPVVIYTYKYTSAGLYYMYILYYTCICTVYFLSVYLSFSCVMFVLYSCHSLPQILWKKAIFLGMGDMDNLFCLQVICKSYFMCDKYKNYYVSQVTLNP